jgi:hypothetical protein
MIYSLERIAREKFERFDELELLFLESTYDRRSLEKMDFRERIGLKIDESEFIFDISLAAVAPSLDEQLTALWPLRPQRFLTSSRFCTRASLVAPSMRNRW